MFTLEMGLSGFEASYLARVLLLINAKNSILGPLFPLSFTLLQPTKTAAHKHVISVSNCVIFFMMFRLEQYLRKKNRSGCMIFFDEAE
jgi:hypothetical protein